VRDFDVEWEERRRQGEIEIRPEAVLELQALGRCGGRLASAFSPCELSLLRAHGLVHCDDRRMVTFTARGARLVEHDVQTLWNGLQSVREMLMGRPVDPMPVSWRFRLRRVGGAERRRPTQERRHRRHSAARRARGPRAPDPSGPEPPPCVSRSGSADASLPVGSGWSAGVAR
jgi:hypothetical protein